MTDHKDSRALGKAGQAMTCAVTQSVLYRKQLPDNSHPTMTAAVNALFAL